MATSFDELRADLESPRPWVREAAALALGESRDPRAPDVLLSAVRGLLAKGRVHAAAGDALMLQAAVEALALLGDRRAEPLLREALTWEQPALRVAAASAFARLGGRVDSGALLPVLADPDPRVRCACLATLGQLAGHGADGPLAGALGDPDPEVRASAAAVLRRRGEKALVDAVERAVDGRPAVVQRLGDQRAVAPLVRMLGHADQAARRGALRALRGLLPLDAVPLAFALQAGDAAHRSAMAAGVARLGASVVGALRVLLDNRDWRVRSAAAEALGLIGAAAAPALEDLRHLVGEEQDDDPGDGEEACAPFRDAIWRIAVSLTKVPVELEAASAPAGIGTEPEAAAAPAGRGTELASSDAPDAPVRKRRWHWPR